MRWMLLACLLAAVAVWPAAPAAAAKDKGEGIGQKIEKERRNLEKIRAEIEAKKRRAEEADRKKESVLQGIQELDNHLQTARGQHREVARQLQKKDEELDAINAEVAIVRLRVAERRASILTRLRVQYMEGRFGYFKALLSADSYEALQRRYQYLSAVSKREYDLMNAYRSDLVTLQQVEQQAAAARDEMLAYKDQTERKLNEIHGLKQQKKSLLARIIQQKESYQRAAAELERSAEKVDGLLKELEQRRQAAAVRPKQQKATFKPYRGLLNLQWPTDGEVVSFFGRQKHPSFETYVQRKGIEIRTDEGSPIHAVMAGTVAYADWLKGYGLVMILDHGNGFFSLYAHASRLLARVGQSVGAGHLIGETGDTGVTGESTLYFELRQGTDPIDPIPYLPKRQ